MCCKGTRFLGGWSHVQRAVFTFLRAEGLQCEVPMPSLAHSKTHLLQSGDVPAHQRHWGPRHDCTCAYWQVVTSGLLLPCLLDGELTDQHGAPVPNARVRVLQQAPDHAAQGVPLAVLSLCTQAPAVSTISRPACSIAHGYEPDSQSNAVLSVVSTTRYLALKSTTSACSPLRCRTGGSPQQVPQDIVLDRGGRRTPDSACARLTSRHGYHMSMQRAEGLSPRAARRAPWPAARRRGRPARGPAPRTWPRSGARTPPAGLAARWLDGAPGAVTPAEFVSQPWTGICGARVQRQKRRRL